MIKHLLILPLLLLAAQWQIGDRNFTPTSAPTAAWTHQTPNCAAKGSGSSAATCTYSANPTTGWWALCSAMNYEDNPGTFAVTDNAATPNTYTQIAGITNYTISYHVYMALFLAHIASLPSSGTLTTTLTPGTPFYPYVACETYSDTGSSPALDSSSASPCDAGNNTAPAGTFSCSTGLTPAADDAIQAFVLMNAGGGSCTYSVGTGLTQGASIGTNDGMNEWGITSSSITPSVVISTGSSCPTGIWAVAVKP